jgi:hypothetical protein
MPLARSFRSMAAVFTCPLVGNGPGFEGAACSDVFAMGAGGGLGGVQQMAGGRE